MTVRRNLRYFAGLHGLSGRSAAIAIDRALAQLGMAERADEPMRRWRFGFRGGRNALIAELNALRAAGVDHIGLHLRRNVRPLDETLREIAEYVLPQFHATAATASHPQPEAIS